MLARQIHECPVKHEQRLERGNRGYFAIQELDRYISVQSQIQFSSIPGLVNR